MRDSSREIIALIAFGDGEVARAAGMTLRCSTILPPKLTTERLPCKEYTFHYARYKKMLQMQRGSQKLNAHAHAETSGQPFVLPSHQGHGKVNLDADRVEAGIAISLSWYPA